MSPDDLLVLASAARDCPYELLHWAGRVRTKRFGNAVVLCSIVPGRLGGCGEDCKWCAQAGRSAAGLAAKRTALEEIVSAADRAKRNGAARLGIVNSGRGPSRRDLDEVVAAVKRIRAGQSGLRVCASLGELTPEAASELARAGVTRYHHNLETSRGMYEQMVTTHTYDDRLATLAAARGAGLSICCGGLFGLGETWADRVELALTIRDTVRPDVVPLNFLHPIPGTPLENVLAIGPMEILTIVALFRLAMPQVDLKVAGGRESNLRDLQSWIFHAGATSMIVGGYLTTPSRSVAEDRGMLADLGLTVVGQLPGKKPIAARRVT